MNFKRLKKRKLAYMKRETKLNRKNNIRIIKETKKKVFKKIIEEGDYHLLIMKNSYREIVERYVRMWFFKNDFKIEEKAIQSGTLKQYLIISIKDKYL
jgi:hypothetical protein